MKAGRQQGAEALFEKELQPKKLASSKFSLGYLFYQNIFTKRCSTKKPG
jgi:hypothetical protein